LREGLSLSLSTLMFSIKLMGESYEDVGSWRFWYITNSTHNLQLPTSNFQLPTLNIKCEL
jgi:hypothetical protein